MGWENQVVLCWDVGDIHLRTEDRTVLRLRIRHRRPKMRPRIEGSAGRVKIKKNQQKKNTILHADYLYF